MSEKLKTVRLYGALGKRFGRVHQLAISTPREAVKALSNTIDGFAGFLLEAESKGLGFTVFRGKENIGPEQYEEPSGKTDIRIAPVVLGSKQAGLFQIVVGVVLLVAGFFLGGTTWGPAMMMLGGALAVSGVISSLTTQAVTDSAGDKEGNRASYNFNGPVNTEAQGNPVPILYGELIIGSAVISAGIFTEDEV